MRSEDHVFHQRGGVQRQHDRSAVCEVLRCGCGAGAVGGERVHGFGADVVNPQWMPGVEEPMSDG